MIKSLAKVGSSILRQDHCCSNLVNPFKIGNVCSSLLVSRRQFSIYEPSYLDTHGPQVEQYELLNFQIKGYDFPVLESYGKYVHKTADRMGLNVEDCWATPAQVQKVTKLKPESTVVDDEYILNLYERNVQISDVPATLLPLFVNVIEASLPAGVTLRVQPHIQEYFEARFVPDLKLKELRGQLDTMISDKEKEREAHKK